MARKAASPKKPSLKTILRRLNPNVPAGQRGDAMPRFPRDSNAMRQIRTHVSADPLAKLLFSGHIGVGKSTELLHLADEMESERWVIPCSVAGTLGVHNVSTFSLLVVLLEAVTHSWVEKLGQMPPGLVEELVRHIRDLHIPVPFRVRASTGQQLLNLYGEVLQRIALRSVPLEQVLALDPTPIASSCELVLKELESAAGKPVLVLIDDLDKVRNEEVRDEVFLNRAMAWLRLPCGIVSTLPLDAVFSSIGRELDQVWGDVQVLDPLPAPTAEGDSVDDPALQPYLSILRSIDAQEVFSALQCRKLANASSGLPRLFVSVCATCIRYALDTKGHHVREHHIDLVMRDLMERWRGRLEDSDYQALLGVLDTEGSNVPKALHLLRDGILVRDGTAPPERRFRLAAWAEPFVDTYRQRMRRQQSSPR